MPYKIHTVLTDNGTQFTSPGNVASAAPEIRKAIYTTNVIESPQSGVRMRTRRVTRWRDGAMALRWTSAAMLAAEKRFRRIMGYRQLWMLKAYLDEEESAATVAAGTKVA